MLYALLKSKVPTLTPAQVKKYLDAHERNAASLLAAFRTTGDSKLLAEALEKFPNDPQVAFEAAIGNNASPQEQRQSLDALKQSAPENSLANYLSGVAYMKAGQTAEAVQDFAAAAGKPQFQDYAQDRIQSDEEAYLSAGYPPGEAKLMANAFLATPQFVQVKEAGQSFGCLGGHLPTVRRSKFTDNDASNGRKPRPALRRSFAERNAAKSTHRHLDRTRCFERNGPQRLLRIVRPDSSTTS